jgi:TonB family protein
MNRQTGIIIIVFAGILGLLSGLFIVKWRAEQKPKVAMIRSYSELPPLATVIKRVEPTYPLAALKDRLEGTVQLRVTVGEDGSVTSTGVIKGVRKDIDSAAKQAVKLWKFKPSSGMAIVSLDFKLDTAKMASRQSR